MMGLASHYVIGNLLEVLEKKDFEKAENQFKIFVKKYSDDSELSEIHKVFKEFLKNNDERTLDDTIRELKELKRLRGTESGGGTKLPFRDRRRFWGG